MKQEKEIDCQTFMYSKCTRQPLIPLCLQYLLNFIVSEHYHVVHLFKAHLSDQLS